MIDNSIRKDRETVGRPFEEFIIPEKSKEELKRSKSVLILVCV